MSGSLDVGGETLDGTAKSKNLECTNLYQIAVGVKVLVTVSGREAQRMIRAIAILLRNTTWKCGRMERLVVNYLRRKLQRCGRAQTPVRDMLQYFKLSGKQKSEFFEAIRRLERRHIILIRWKQCHLQYDNFEPRHEFASMWFFERAPKNFTCEAS